MVALVPAESHDQMNNVTPCLSSSNEQNDATDEQNDAFDDEVTITGEQCWY